MQPVKILSVLCVILFLNACQKEQSGSAIYQGCCDDAPVSFEAGAGRIYVPNVFTPNGDGINDLFAAFTDEKIESFISFEIFNRSGEVIYIRENYQADWRPQYPWLGTNPDNSQYEGQFSYRIEVLDIHGEQVAIQGQACALSCENPANIDPTFCAFPQQHSGTGKLAPSLPNGEDTSACFE